MNRRQFLHHSLVLGGASLIPWVPLRSEAAHATNQVVFIFVRGGWDPLAILEPLATSSDYRNLRNLRPNLLCKNPRTYAGLSLNAAMSPLVTDSQLAAGLGFVLHTGSLNKTRSHFVQQDLIETGSASTVGTSGFLARAGKEASRRCVAIHSSVPKSMKTGNPIVLRDPAALDEKYAASVTKPGWSRAQRMGLYRSGGASNLDKALDQTAATIVTDFQRVHSSLAANGDTNLDTLLGRSGYLSTRFGRDLAAAGAMLSSAANPGFVAVNAEHNWDTHAIQSNVFDGKIADLAQNLAAFKRDLVRRGKWNSTVVVVMSEFGRTVKENGSLGSDHGEGGLMMLMGGKIKPFASEPLAKRSWTLPGSATSSTALDVRHDYRMVLAEVLSRHMLLTSTEIGRVFTGGQFQVAANYLGLFRT